MQRTVIRSTGVTIAAVRFYSNKNSNNNTSIFYIIAAASFLFVMGFPVPFLLFMVDSNRQGNAE